MRTHRATARTATAVLVALWVVAGWTVGVAPPGVAQTDDEGITRRSALELAQQRLDDARRHATDAAQRLADAESHRGALTQEIAAAEEEIPRLRSRADDLRRVVRQRAAQLYVRSATPQIELIASTATVADAERAAHLTSTIGDHEEAVAAELQDTAHALEARQAQLKEQRAELDRSIAAIAPLRDALDAKLDLANKAYGKVKAALASRAEQPDVTTGAAVCPVRGLVVFTDDFEEPREDGKLHQGIDMPAKEGTPVVAVVDGFSARDLSEAGGQGVWLRGGDDVSYYYAHFSRYEGASEGWVRAGDVLGYVGSTGVSTGPHLHFEVHPLAGVAVDGYPLLLTLCDAETRQTTK